MKESRLCRSVLCQLRVRAQSVPTLEIKLASAVMPTVMVKHATAVFSSGMNSLLRTGLHSIVAFFCEWLCDIALIIFFSLSCSDGLVIGCDSVIVTSSIGHLQHNKQLFQPPLPPLVSRVSVTIFRVFIVLNGRLGDYYDHSSLLLERRLGDYIVRDLETIIVLVLLAFNFIPQRSHHLLTFTRSRLQILYYCNSNAWGWHNSYQSEVIGITNQLILQNGKRLQGVQEEQ